jgi:hypothetical protein
LPPAGTGIGTSSQSGSKKSSVGVNVRFSGLAPSTRSTSSELSIWKVSPLPQPPAARRAAMMASESAAGLTPDTS